MSKKNPNPPAANKPKQITQATKANALFAEDAVNSANELSYIETTKDPEFKGFDMVIKIDDIKEGTNRNRVTRQAVNNIQQLITDKGLESTVNPLDNSLVVKVKPVHEKPIEPMAFSDVKAAAKAPGDE